MKTAVVIRHVHFEHLGALEPALREAGYGVRYLEAPTAAFELQSLPDLLVVLGGPISVNDTEDYPFLASELSLVQRQLEQKLPLLGICLGAQLIARALGARVFPMRGKEVGWSPLELTEAGARHAIRHLAAPGLDVLHWHGETFDLPAGAARLASTPLCENQAFSVGDHALGLQFHPEVTAEQLESWFVGHVGELASIPVQVTRLRGQSAPRAKRLEEPLRRFLNEWLRAWEEPRASGASDLRRLS
ncbi:MULTISPECIES: glutamine amidotransferase [Sorangium]|uniref:glutamine amidotransferase n=1 Tax=Sorangium TaxID=39643 RepID=UPI003D9C30F4